MTQETYRFAYEEANAELREIMAHFEVLQARKEQMEQVVEALSVVLSNEGKGGQVAGEQIPFIVHQSVEILANDRNEPMPEPEFEPEPAYVESADPFQRRIDMALRHGLGKESRIMPRALSGLLSRA
jgi:hypothetical protein